MESVTERSAARSTATRTFVVLGAALAALGVAAGAFGAHTLEDIVTPERIEVFETGVFYHLLHAVALLIVAWVADRYPSPLVRLAGWCLVAGIVIFSGSLYLLVLTDTAWFGAITPIGGVAFIAGWALLAWGVFSSRGT